MSILIVGIYRYLKTGSLCATLAAYRLALGLLLRHQCLYAQLTKLQVGLHAEQCTTTANQTAIQIHRHITCLQRLDDVVLLSLVVKFDIGLVKTEGCFRVVAHVEVQFVADLTIDIHLNLLVEIEDIIVSCAFGQCGVV